MNRGSSYIVRADLTAHDRILGDHNAAKIGSLIWSCWVVDQELGYLMVIRDWLLRTTDGIR